MNIAVRNTNCKIYLLTSVISPKINKECVQVDIDTFYTKLNYPILNNNIKFRNGFWVKTTERFFIISEFTKKFNITSYFHAELDNLIFDLSSLSVKLDCIGKGLFIPKDDIRRCIASFIYVNDVNVISEFCNYVITNPKSLENDMLLLGDFSYNLNNVFFLPNESIFGSKSQINYLNYNYLDGIFDAAAIGQFLFGIDPRNSRLPIFNKFINENAKCELSKCMFEVSVKDNIAKVNDINLYNIHVHSKIFEKIEKNDWMVKLITRINKNKKTFIKFRFI